MATVVVTGCSSGFGLLAAVELARRGHAVVATMRDRSRAGDLRAALGDAGVEADLETLDIARDGSVRAAIDRVLDHHGRIDAVVNNAGVAVGGPVEETSIADLATVMDTNVFGAVRVTQAVLPVMREQGGGHIVNVTSIAAFVAPPFMGAYAASKHALDAIGESLAAEVAPFNIKVTNVAPGAYDTRMLSDVEAVMAAADPRSPYADRLSTALRHHAASMKQSGTPADVACAIADVIESDAPPARVVVPPASAFIVQARGTTPPEQLRQLLAQSYGV